MTQVFHDWPSKVTLVAVAQRGSAPGREPGLSSPLTLIPFDVGWPPAVLTSVPTGTVKKEMPASWGCYRESWEVMEEETFGGMVPTTVLGFPYLQALLLLNWGLRKVGSAQPTDLEGFRKP